MSNRWTLHFNTAKKNKEKVDQLWTTQYAPKCTDDLAVHKAKISSLEALLTHRLQINSEPFLLLTGPSGCGKATAVSLIAKKLSASIHEWVNPVSPDQTVLDEEICSRVHLFHDSQVVQFSDFLFRVNRYKSLTFSKTDENKRIFIVKDFPNVFLRDQKKFYEIIKKYSLLPKAFPCVFIVSDNNESSNLKRMLFPPELINDGKIEVLKFNPIALTSMVKALQNVARLASESKLPNFEAPSKVALEEIAQTSNGDIRLAINSLQFICQKTSVRLNIHSKLPNKRKISVNKKSGTKKAEAKTSTDELSVGAKDTTLSLFRILGKVLHCKRLPSYDSAEVKLPAHLSQFKRKTLSFDPEAIFDKSCLSSDMYVAFLHQNYVDFCDLECLSQSSDYLSEGDILSSNWSTKSMLTTYQASLVTRGLVFCIGGSSTESIKPGWMPLHKPAALSVMSEISKTKEAIKENLCLMAGNYTTLVTETLPFQAKMPPTFRNTPLNSLIHKIGAFKKGSRRILLEKFDEGCNADFSEYESNSHNLEDFHFCSTTAAREIESVESDNIGEDLYIEDVDD